MCSIVIVTRRERPHTRDGAYVSALLDLSLDAITLSSDAAMPIRLCYGLGPMHSALAAALVMHTRSEQSFHR